VAAVHMNLWFELRLKKFSAVVHCEEEFISHCDEAVFRFLATAAEKKFWNCTRVT
jgi:hypothetical protein